MGEHLVELGRDHQHRAAGIAQEDVRKGIDYLKKFDNAGSRKALDAELKSLEAGLADERDLLAFHNGEVQRQYDAGLISLEQFYAQRRLLAERSTDEQRSLLDQEQQALERSAATASRPEDRADAEARIADVLRRKAVLEREAGQAAVIAADDQARATAQLRGRVADLDEQIGTLAGNDYAQQLQRVAEQTAAAERVLAQAGEGPERAQRFAQLATQQVELNELRRQYTEITTRAQLAEDKFQSESESTGRSQVEVETGVAEIRTRAVTALTTLIAKTRELADASQNPAALEFLQQLEASYARAALDVDPAITKLREVGKQAGESIASGFETAIVEGQNLRDLLGKVRALGTEEDAT